MSSKETARTEKAGGVRAAVTLLLLVPILIPLFAVMLIFLSEREAVRLSEERVVAAARVSAANIRLLVESTLDRLHRIDDTLGSDPAKFVSRGTTGGGGFTVVYSASGETIGREGATGSGAAAAGVASNAEFKALAAGESWRITPLLGTAESARFFGIARRIERRGRFAGVITAYLPADTLSQTWASVGLGVDSTLGVIRSDGQLVTRFPVPNEGVDMASNDLFTKYLKQAPHGIYASAVSPVDGKPRTVAYEALEDLGIVATASMSQSLMADAFWEKVRTTSMVAVPIFAVLLALCVWTILLLLRQERSRTELSAALAQNRVLFQEIHHRVKNNLQAVASMVRLQNAPAAMKEDLTRRIAAMTAVHQHIYESDQFGALDAEAYLAKLLAGLRESAPPGVELDWRLSALRLSPDQALPLGLIVNEVVSNAYKHGFPNGRAGKVSVAIERPLDGNQAVLTIADNGIGMPEAAAPGGVGLGTRLIAGLAAQLEGKTTFVRDSGMRFELRFPISA